MKAPRQLNAILSHDGDGKTKQIVFTGLSCAQTHDREGIGFDENLELFGARKIHKKDILTGQRQAIWWTTTLPSSSSNAIIPCGKGNARLSMRSHSFMWYSDRFDMLIFPCQLCISLRIIWGGLGELILHALLWSFGISLHSQLNIHSLTPVTCNPPPPFFTWHLQNLLGHS